MSLDYLSQLVIYLNLFKRRSEGDIWLSAVSLLRNKQMFNDWCGPQLLTEHGLLCFSLLTANQMCLTIISLKVIHADDSFSTVKAAIRYNQIHINFLLVTCFCQSKLLLPGVAIVSRCFPRCCIQG